MKRYIGLNVMLISVVILLSSCGSMLYTSIDVLRPASVTFTPEASRLLIVNNTVRQPEDYGHRTQFFNEKARVESKKTDSLPLFCIEALAQEISGREYFSNITLHNININSNTDFFTITNIPFDTVNALCDRYDSDVILSLERIRVIDKIDEYYLNDEAEFYLALEARYETRWSVYYPQKTSYETITIRDTLFWDARTGSKRRAMEMLPNRYDALIDGALYNGRNSINKFIPYWDKVDRYFFSGGNKLLTQGMDSVTVKSWEGATKVWEGILTSKASSFTKAKAAHNIAVVNEISGNMEAAWNYIEKAVDYLEKSAGADSNSSYNIVVYYEELYKRRLETELLDKQIGH